ncbi:MAG: mechanosensitive ion channel family protein [Microcystaceae cyanobacterium]
MPNFQPKQIRKHYIQQSYWLGIILMAMIIFWGLVANSQDQTLVSELEEIGSVTTKDRTIPPEELKLLVKSFTQPELEIESQGWLLILKDKVAQISEREIAVKRQTKNIESALENQPPTESKTELITSITELQGQKTGLIERLDVVLDELELKGGNAETYRKYVQAVSGVEIDITDTNGLWVRIVSWLISPEGGLKFGFSIIRLIGTLLFFGLVGKILNRFFEVTHRQYIANQLDNQIEPIFRRVTHLMIWLIVAIVTLSSIGFDVTAIITSLGIGGLAFALAAQDTVANLFGGVTLLLQRSIQVGDRIEIDGIKARVVEIGLRITTLKELEYDYLIFVPNSKFANNMVSNIDSRSSYANYVFLNLAYDMSIEKIELALDLIKEVAAKNQFVKGARPTLNKIGDYSFEIKFVYWIDKWKPDEKELFPNDLWKMYTVKSQVNLEIIRQFEKHNIQITLPTEIRLNPKESPESTVFNYIKKIEQNDQL